MGNGIQASKRGRKHRRQAKFARLRGNTAHPSHIPAKKWRRWQERFVDKPFGREEEVMNG